MDGYFRFSASSNANIYAQKILNSEEYFENCKKCGTVHLKKEIQDISLEIEGRGRYPDILLCGHWPLLIVSDKVVKLWNENNISDYDKFKVKLFKSNGEEILNKDAKYHHIKVTGSCGLDLEAMGITINKQCELCGNIKYSKETWQFGTPIIKQNQVSKTDIFVFEQFKNSVICGMKNIKIIHDNKLTNFSITKMEDMFDYCADEIDIKKLF